MTAARAAAGSAAAVSRALARGGFRPLPSETPHSRQGLRVKRSLTSAATVVADYDSAREAGEAGDAATIILTAAGYTVERVSTRLLRVTS